MKNPFSRKKNKGIPKDQVPRSKEEIQAEYDQIRLKVGQAQYQSFVYSEEVKQLNLLLLNLNREANARQQLDAAAPKAQTPKTEVTNDRQ